jgi:DNA/RNA endonuclease YhcR with UshA esterase domain
MRASFFFLLFCLLTAGNLLAEDITPDDAAKHVGEVVTVRGTVVQVFLSKGGNAYLNFGAAFPNQTFSADVLAKQTPQLLAGGSDWLTVFEGKAVVVTGKIQMYKGKPEIVITAREDVGLAK